MNILFVTMTHPTTTRPLQGMFNFHLIESLRRRHDVRAIAPIPWPQRLVKRSVGLSKHKAELTSAMSQHVHCPIYFYVPSLFHSQSDSFYFHSIWPTVQSICRSFSPDLVVGYWVHPDGSAAQQIAERRGVPCVLVSGGSDLKCLPRDRNRRSAIETVLSKVDRLIVVSKDLEKTAIQLGVAASKIDVIYRGVDGQIFKPLNREVARATLGLPHDSIVICWSGRLESVKNPLMLIEAAAHWKQIWGERLMVLLMGEGSMRRQIERRILELGLAKQFRMEGHLNQRELALRFNAANVTVLTSHSEGVPNVLLESITCNTPFVATDVGGVSEIATPGLDRIVAVQDIPLLVQEVIDVVDSDSRLRRIYQPTGLDESAMQFERVFQQVCDLPLESNVLDDVSPMREAG